ncbi:leucine-rich repeat protein [Clostridium oceanicum]|uniref:Uncharacterized protein n=1 Tax=Clostridium oceanicum TaxID=1543 RepID=A0ABN1JR28_9CLOT
MKRKGVLASAALLSLIMATSLNTTNVKAAKGQVERLAGKNRYETSFKVATLNWEKSDKVILVSGEGYADSLSAAVLSKKLNAPIILTSSKKLDENAKRALKTLKAKEVYVIGGEISVSKSIREELKKDNYKLVELGGENRFETNLAVANYLADDLKFDTSNVLAVNGKDGFSDALSVAPIAASKGQVLLITSKNINDVKLAGEFVEKHKSNVTVVGTENLVPKEILNVLGVSEKNRVNGGANRFETNLNVLKHFNIKSNNLYVANARGERYADALVASALAGKFGAPLVLTDTKESKSTENAIGFIKGYVKNNKDVQIKTLGGYMVMPNEVIEKVNDVLKEQGKEESQKDTDNQNTNDKNDKGSSSSSQTTSDEDVVTIKNTKLKEAINHSIDKNRKADEKITKADMKSLKKLSSDFLPIVDKTDTTANGTRGISDLTGLEYAINLQELDLSENSISDLSPLSNLTKIKWLEVDRNYIKDLSPLSKMTVLEHLNIYNNGGIVDLTPISKLKSIKWIDMHHCSRSEAPLNVEVLKNLVNLEYLSFETNKITDLSFVKSLPNLKTLSCNNTFVTDLEPVQDLAISAFNDWSGERFFNMFGQKLDAPFKIKTNDKGGEYRFKSPVKNYERYKAHVEKTIKEQYGEEVKAPAVNDKDVDVDYVKFDFDHDTNEVVVKVDPNKTGKSRQYKVQILLDYGMYSLRENFEIVQDGKESISSVDESDFKFKDGSITKYVGNKSNVVIPSKIGGKEVTSIENEAFTDCSSLESIEIPGSIKSIGKDAFYNCDNLTSATISEGVENINDTAFYKCSALKSVIIPKSVKRIGDHAFYNCNSLSSLKILDGLKELGFGAFLHCEKLTSVDIPKSIETINEWAFAECDNLREINVDENNKNYSDIDGMLCNKDKTVLIQYIDKYGDSYTVPEGIKKLAKGAFNAAKIKSITLPKSLEVIGFSAFEKCQGLQSIKIPENVTTIDHFAFAFCDNIKSVFFNEKVKSIGNNAFKDCKNLDSIKIPESISSIGQNSFQGCTNLKTVTIDNSKENISIEPTAFLDSVEINYLK